MFYSDGEGTKYFSMPEENISDFQQRVSRAIQDDFKHLVKPKHISDMSKEEKHSMAEKMGISGHKEMTEKELSKQLIERKIDNELKERGKPKSENDYLIKYNKDGVSSHKFVKDKESAVDEIVKLQSEGYKTATYPPKDWKDDFIIKKSFEDSINILKGEQLEGGLGDNLSVEDIAKNIKYQKKQLKTN